MEKRVPKPTATAVLGMMAGLLLSIPAAQAWDVKYNFTASGRILTLTGAGAEYTEGPEKTVSGAVTFKVLRVAPPADGWRVAEGNAIDGDQGVRCHGWVRRAARARWLLNGLLDPVRASPPAEPATVAAPAARQRTIVA